MISLILTWLFLGLSVGSWPPAKRLPGYEQLGKVIRAVYPKVNWDPL